MVGDDLEKRIGTAEAAEILGCNQRSVGRYIERGWLKAKKTKEGYRPLRRLTDDLKKRLYAQSLVGDQVKEFYVFKRCGAPLWSVAAEYGIEEDMIDAAIRQYGIERRTYLKRFGLEKSTQGNVFQIQEVTARLKIVDSHVVYELIEEKELRARTVPFGGSIRNFIYVGSFCGYLGNDVNDVFYTSREVSEMIGESVHWIDKIALKHGIGRKIREGRKNSSYLFIPNEVAWMRSTSNSNH